MQVLFLLILIILEITLTILIVIGINILDKKVKDFHEKFILLSTEVLILNDKIKETISKTNKVLNFITNKRLYQIINIAKVTFNTIQFILFIRTFDFKKGILNYKNLKRLFLSEIARRFLRKILLDSAKLV